MGGPTSIFVYVTKEAQLLLQQNILKSNLKFRPWYFKALRFFCTYEVSVLDMASLLAKSKLVTDGFTKFVLTIENDLKR